MRITILLILLLTGGNGIADDGKGNYAIWGVGNNSCFSYLKARENNDFDAYKLYLTGYLTAYNALTPDTFRISGTMDMDGIIEWIDNYCKSKQLDGFLGAISAYTSENAGKRMKRPPRALHAN